MNNDEKKCKKCKELERLLSNANEQIIKVSDQRDENHTALMILSGKVSISDANAEHWRKCASEYMDKYREIEQELSEIRAGAIESAKVKKLESTIAIMATKIFGVAK